MIHLVLREGNGVSFKMVSGQCRELDQELESDSYVSLQPRGIPWVHRPHTEWTAIPGSEAFMPFDESPASELLSLRAMNETLVQNVADQTKILSETNQELRAAEEDLRLAAVAFESHDSMMVTDHQGRILRVNGGFTRMTGFTPEEVIGKTPRLLRSGRHTSAFYRQMWATIRQAGCWSGELWNRRKDGRVYAQRLTITAVRNAQGETSHFVGSGQDITDERQAESDRQSISAARKVQEDLLPSHVPKACGFDIAGAVYPADRVSGDYFDYLSLGPKSIGILVADVSGHGLGAALLTAQMQAYLRALAESCDDPGELLTHANRLLTTSHSGHFVTVFLGRLDFHTKSFVYAGAGHRGFLVAPHCPPKELSSTSIPLGIDDSLKVPSAPPYSWEAGDLIVLPTDGFEEALNPQGIPFGCERVLAFVKECSQQSASDIVQAIHLAASSFLDCVEQQDDMTIVIAKLLPEN